MKKIIMINIFPIFNFDLSDFQKSAIESIVSGNHCLITAHTGSGKTLPAEFAIQYFKEKGKRLFIRDLLKHYVIKNYMILEINIQKFLLEF